MNGKEKKPMTWEEVIENIKQMKDDEDLVVWMQPFDYDIYAPKEASDG